MDFIKDQTDRQDVTQRLIMIKKTKQFIRAVGLVWKSAPGWTSANVLLSVLKSFLPLVLLYLIKNLIDLITWEASAPDGEPGTRLLKMIFSVVIIWFIDEAASDIGNYLRK